MAKSKPKVTADSLLDGLHSNQGSWFDRLPEVDQQEVLKAGRQAQAQGISMRSLGAKIKSSYGLSQETNTIGNKLKQLLESANG